MNKPQQRKVVAIRPSRTRVGQAIINHRKDRNISQGEAADVVNIATHRYSRIERGSTIPTEIEIRKISYGLQAPSQPLMDLAELDRKGKKARTRRSKIAAPKSKAKPQVKSPMEIKNPQIEIANRVMDLVEPFVEQRVALALIQFGDGAAEDYRRVDSKVNKLIVVLGLGLVVFVAGLIYAGAAQADCYDRAWGGYGSADATFVRQVRIKPVLHRTDFSCGRSFNCVVDHAPLEKRRLNIYLGRRLPNRVLFGNAGWEKSVATARSSNTARIKYNRKLKALVGNAVEISRGVELESLVSKPENIAGDRDVHDRFAAENNCDNRKHPGTISSFNEAVRIPKFAWAALRHSEGWFF